MILDKLERIGRECIHLPQSRHKHFSFIVRRNKIISFGYSRSRWTHPIANRYGYIFDGIHSELDAILRFPYPVSELQYYDFINLRLTVKGFGNSKPCAICNKLLNDFGINKVIYTTKNGWVQ